MSWEPINPDKPKDSELIGDEPFDIIADALERVMKCYETDCKPTLEPDLKRRLFPHLGGIFRELDASPLLVNGPTDHVHILAVLPAKLAPAEIIGTVKANSSGWVYKKFRARGTFAWQVGYAAFGVSPSLKQTVLDYIANQEEHHRKVSFKEELIAFLKRHEIKYDERYLWE